MKQIKILLSIAAAAVCAVAAAQTTADEFQARYERLVQRVGYDGVGVETLLDRWGEAFPDDMRVPIGRFNFYYHRGHFTEMGSVPGARRFLGREPVLTLKDSNGQDVPYFEEDFFDDEPFGEALKIVDERIAAQPDELRWYYIKISALADYEKDSPDMCGSELRKLIMRHATTHPAWTLDGEPAGQDAFQQGVGEYCARFFEIGSEASYDLFFQLSTMMNKYFPQNTVFIDNIGSYWLIARNNEKTAIKYYKKALKIDPEDYAAQRNLKIIERRQAQAKKK